LPCMPGSGLVQLLGGVGDEVVIELGERAYTSTKVPPS
jgi:hypothetical protein